MTKNLVTMHTIEQSQIVANFNMRGALFFSQSI